MSAGSLAPGVAGAPRSLADVASGAAARGRALWHRSSVARIAMLASATAGVGVLYTLGALLPFWYLSDPALGSPFFPAAGLTVSVLILTDRRYWPLWLGAVAICELAIDLTHHIPLSLALVFVVANTGEPLVGALALVTMMRRPTVGLRRPVLAYLGCCVVLAPLFGAVVGATGSLLFGSGSNWAEIASRWWLGDALGVLAVATAIISWCRRWQYDASAPLAEVVAMVAVTMGITIIPAILWGHPLFYAVLPVLMWAAMRGGAHAVSAAGVGMTFAAGWVVITGRTQDLLATADGGEQLAFVQVYIGLTLLAGMALTMEIAERRRLEAVALRAQAERSESEHMTVNAANAERRRIARETHDIVGHALNVILLEAGVARRVVAVDAARARDHLESIEAVGRAAFADLDLALASVDAYDAGTGRGLESVPELLDGLRSAGVDVHLEVEGDVRPVSTLVDWSTFRIVQEALTNVAKHSPDARATVTIRYRDDGVYIDVVDDGRGHLNGLSHREGRGLIGIRERVAVLAGSIQAGPERGGGFGVRVVLPITDPR